MAYSDFSLEKVIEDFKLTEKSTFLFAQTQVIDLGLGQCAAQMLGAQVFNQHQQNPIEFVFGCVTTGNDWQFLKLVDQILWIDEVCYYITDLGKILGILQCIIDMDAG
jgi:hypothetical protein